MKRARRSADARTARRPVAAAESRPHVPTRTCAGCGERSPQAAMRRMSLLGEAQLTWREHGGRGAYLHAKGECRDRFLSGKKRVPGLRATVGREARLQLIEKWLVLS